MDAEEPGDSWRAPRFLVTRIKAHPSLKRSTVTAGLFVLTTSLAVAQTATPPAAGGLVTTATTRANDMKDWQIARTAKVGLAQAIGTAEMQGDEKGGRAIDADF